jgi:uncharacterized membrane protein YozB (DUF420 family)
MRRSEAAFVGQGFLGTGASLESDLALLIEVAMGAALIVGRVLARRRRYRAHAWCQSAVVLLNLVVIGTTMAPIFHRQVAPRIPARLGRSYYAVAAAHGFLGAVAELFGVFILVAAGTNILPQRFRLISYKAWMRRELALWWAVLLLGLGTYARWYVLPMFGR